MAYSSVGERTAAFVHRHGAEVETFRGLREVGERIDVLARRADPVPHVLVERVNVAIDLVGKLDHRRLDDALGQLADVEGELLRRELEIHALSLVHSKENLPSCTSCATATAPSRTVKSVGRRIEIVSPFS
jgi:hypothetical protein